MYKESVDYWASHSSENAFTFRATNLGPGLELFVVVVVVVVVAVVVGFFFLETGLLCIALVLLELTLLTTLASNSEIHLPLPPRVLGL